MKNLCSYCSHSNYKWGGRSFVKIKLILLFLFVGLFNVLGTTGYSQNDNIRLSAEDTSLKEVIEIIENQSDYRFVYNSNLVDLSVPVSISYNGNDIEEVVSQLFNNGDVEYSVIENHIILIPKQLTDANETVQQQKVTITGSVVDNAGEPLPGVTIIEKGTTNGVISDIDGNYSITVFSEDAVLVYSYIGFETQNVPTAGRTNIDVVLAEEIAGIDEVVVIGYGSQKKSDITGSVAVVDMEALPVKSPVSVAQTLQGTAPGVQVVNSGAPGDAPLIRIRGLSSFGNNEPLYVIDGVPGVGNRDFNPHDVESIQILKDASAAAIYGSRAANGVILITTKKGNDKFSIDFEGRYGVEEVPKRIDVMNAHEFATLDNMAHDNAGLSHNPASDMVIIDPSSMPDTDWQGYMFQPGVIQDYNFSVSNKTDKSSYRASLGYFDREGVIRGPEFKRTSVSFSSTHDYGRLLFGSSVRLGYTEASDVIGGPFFDALTALPNVAIYDENNVGGYGAGSDFNQTYFVNPVGNQLSKDNRAHTYKSVINLYGEYKFTDFLKYKFTTSVDAANQRWIGKRKAAYLRYKDNPVSSLDERTTHWLDWSLNHLLTFDKTFGQHKFTAVGVYSYEGHKDRFSRAYGEDVSQDGEGKYFWVIRATKENQTVDGTAGEWGMHSAISRINYSYNNKYLLQLSGRYDYSSKFKKENRDAFFPAASLGWKISEESFLDADFIDLLKLRVGYGELGNTPRDFYGYTGYINSNVNYVLGTDQSVANGATQIRLANPDLIWETTATANIGVDFAFLRNKIQGSIEVYQTDTRDAILPVDLALSTGNYAGNPEQNIGDLRNKGIEFALTYQNREHEFKYRANLNVSSNKNEVVSMGEMGEFAANLTMTRPGYAIGTFFLRETDGIFQLGEEEEAAKQGAFPGDVHYIDVNGRDLETNELTGEPDGQINDDDRVMMGDPFPLADIGFNFQAEYKGFDLSVFLFSQLGHDIFWGQGYVLERTDDYINHLEGHNPWTPDNKSNTTPIAMYGAAGSRNHVNTQDRFLYKGDYLKLKNLEIGYTLPSSLMSQVGIKKFRVYFSGQNLLTFTNYPGFDPEVVNWYLPERGVDWGAYPNPRTISFGVQAKF